MSDCKRRKFYSESHVRTAIYAISQRNSAARRGPGKQLYKQWCSGCRAFHLATVRK